MPIPTANTVGGQESTAAAQGAAAVTPSNTVDLANGPTRALWVGGAGDISLDFAQGDTVTLVGVPVGLLPVSAKRIRVTGTTATNIVALY